MNRINKNDNILILTHNDLDSAGTVIVLSSIFKNIEIISTNYRNVDMYLAKIDYNKFKHILMTDISPSQNLLLNISDKIKLWDHHETALFCHDPSKMRFIDISKCATIIIKEFFEKYFNVDLKQYDLFCKLINDYDLFLRKDMRSWGLNELFYKIGYRKFLIRFANGKINFSQEEFLYIKERYNQYKRCYDNLEVNELSTIKGCFIIASEFMNDLASDLMKFEGYKIVFIYDPTHESLSIRQCLPDLNIGQFLKDLQIGGGHHDAAGIKRTGKDIIQPTLKLLEKLLYEKYEGLRK
jgi:oligoribonuclease NrnB/cAMP/cGMP phosphodiesterase (DHH superfamily)